MTPAPIRIAAALVIGQNRHTLLVRKRGRAFFLQPGGEIDAGGTPREALARELQEELGLRADPAALATVGRFAAPAANETGATVEAELFRLDWTAGALAARAEIAWSDPGAVGDRPLAPLTRDHVLALCRPGRAS